MGVHLVTQAEKLGTVFGYPCTLLHTTITHLFAFSHLPILSPDSIVSLQPPLPLYLGFGHISFVDD